MSPRPARLLLPLALGTQVLIYGFACEEDSEGKQHAAPPVINIDDVRYEGGMTDEAVQSILGVPAIINDDKAPLASAPQEGAIVPPSPPFTFTWSASSVRRAPLPSWMGPERSAFAHGTPYTGVAYILTFHTSLNPKLVRVATSKTSYTPDEAAWNDLKTAGCPITLTLTVARTENNNVVVGGGPYTSSKGITFTIGP
ncbi:MAG: hypothetical protein RMJ98_21560 [Myxococcales bacterium]|nr:hypothetical protein [Polyangiaceae bacterium]MDW8251892.1 hypothetical protein [Myxococcales bacterium]